jgi:exonuclease SbcC
MKIHSLSLKNINSLAGVHEIDFTHPRFTNEGLFAITGKTGAGKSTILDAISLALYGKTARLGLISGNENNLMTRGTSDCFSEIVFSVSGKTWKASWKQERTKTGKLKAINRIIADGDNQIIADQVRACDQAIEKILGLTFEQFTKVILLAQGSFAAFLQANKNEKGELLEQITGTEIYAEISIAVHNKLKEESDKLLLIETELNAINVLSEEEEEALLNELNAAESNKKEITVTIENIQNALSWLESINRLKEQNQEANQSLPALEKRLSEASIRCNELERTHEKRLEFQKEQQIVFRRVRELDTKIKDKEDALTPIQIAFEKLNAGLSTLAQNLGEKQANYADVTAKMLLINNWLTENKQLESLSTEKSMIEAENNRLVQLTNDANSGRKEIDNLINTLESANKNALSTESEWKEAVRRYDETANLLEKTKNEQSALLNGKTIVDISNEKNRFIQHLTTIGQIKALHGDVENCRMTIQSLENQSTSNTKELEQHIKILKLQKKSQLALADRIRLLEENLLLSRSIRDLHEYRQQLKDGVACPLCGALEHPFGNGKNPETNDNQDLLDNAKREYTAVSNTILSEEKEVTRLTTLCEQANEQKTKEADKLKNAEDKLITALQRLTDIYPGQPTVTDAALIKSLDSLENETQNKLNVADQLFETVNKQEKTIESIRDVKLKTADHEKQTAHLKYMKAGSDSTLIANQLDDKIKSLGSLETTLANDISELQTKLKKYNVSNIDELQDCFTRWNENKSSLDALREKKEKLKSDIRIDEVEQNNLQKNIDDKKKDLESIEQALSSLNQERKSMFGEKDVDVEERVLMSSIQEMEELKKEGGNELTEARKAVDNIKSIIEANSKELDQLTTKQITVKTKEELSKEYVEKNKVLSEFLQQIGANTEKRRAADESRKQAGKKLNEKQTQQAVVNKWAQLNDLIGSATGIKFRNFAQALTFEHLVSLSNTQLQKMSDRYLLQRTDDHTNPFELSVIDKYQNSEIRTAQNLSGGEKFIVSLSLALGLANMAGKNMRIDTMFIDEGFGTLDPEYLDVALSALSSLQQDGKIIGVISHLSELKERISTHIEVVSTGNGRAEIKVPN